MQLPHHDLTATHLLVPRYAQLITLILKLTPLDDQRHRDTDKGNP
jgi:hypothetical protein